MLSSWGSERRLLLLRDWGAATAVAVSVFLLSYTNGGFDATTRAYAAIAAWWLIGVGAALTLGTARALTSRFALAAPALLAAYTVWILISLSWAPDDERAFQQFDQVSLYVAILVLAIVLARLVDAAWLVGGIAVALTAIAVIAFVSRVFPSSFPGSTSQGAILNTLYVRLSFPLGYWNGLAIEVALALPLLLSIMVSRRSRVASALAALPLPVIVADMYLTSSRGGFVAALVAVVAYLVLASNRWAALAAAVLTGIAGVLTVFVLHSRHALLNGQMSTPLGVHQGHVLAVAVVLIAIGSALAWFGANAVAHRIPAPPARAGWAAAGVLLVAAIAVLVAAHPLRRLQEFKAQGNYVGKTDFVTAHLLSSSGSGRWQMWSAAVSQFKAHPLNGGGAGSWEFWWLQHRPIPLFSQFAHSLYLEALGELGIVGLLLLLAAVLVAIVGAVRAAFRVRSPEVAGLAACGIAFFVSAAYDWTWQLAGIAMVGVGATGVALGALPSTRVAPWGRFGLVRPALALLAVAAIVPQVVVLASGLHLRNSQIADSAGYLTDAKSQALAAKAVEPWASSPYLQLARIDEEIAKPVEARAMLGEAIERSHDNWQLWLYAAEVDVRLGRIVQAKQEFETAKRLDPIDAAQAGGP